MQPTGTATQRRPTLTFSSSLVSVSCTDLGTGTTCFPMRDSLQVTLSTPLSAAALGVAALKQPVLPAKLQRPAARALNIVLCTKGALPSAGQVLALARRLRVLLGLCWVSFFLSSPVVQEGARPGARPAPATSGDL